MIADFREVLEQTRTSLNFVASPLGHTVKLGPGTLQNRLELDVRQVALFNRISQLNFLKQSTQTSKTHLQVAPVHVHRQPVVGDQQQMVRVDLGRFVHQHRVRHVRQAAPDRLLRVVVGQRPRVRAGGGNVRSEGAPVAVRYRVDGYCNDSVDFNVYSLFTLVMSFCIFFNFHVLLILKHQNALVQNSEKNRIFKILIISKMHSKILKS